MSREACFVSLMALPNLSRNVLLLQKLRLREIDLAYGISEIERSVFIMPRVSLYMKSVGSWDLAHVYGLLIRGMPLARSRASIRVPFLCVKNATTRHEAKVWIPSVNPNSESLPPLLHCPLKSAWNGREKKILHVFPFRRLLFSFYPFHPRNLAVLERVPYFDWLRGKIRLWVWLVCFSTIHWCSHTF